MFYVALILLALTAAMVLLKLRVRLDLAESRWILFVGLGRSGPEFDLTRNVGSIRLWGLTIGRFEIGRDKKKEVEKKKKKAKAGKPSKPRKPSKRTRASLGDFYHVGRKCLRPFGVYLVRTLKAVTVEELEGQIRGGFDSPDLTGSVFGYYQAALAAAPAVVGRVRFIPDWTGPSFTGAAHLALTIRLYKLLARTVVLACRLPLRDLLKLAIGRKKGVSDVQQRR